MSVVEVQRVKYVLNNVCRQYLLSVASACRTRQGSVSKESFSSFQSTGM